MSAAETISHKNDLASNPLSEIGEGAGGGVHP